MTPDISIIQIDLILSKMAFSEAISKLGKTSNLAGYTLTVHPNLLDKAIEIKDDYDLVDSMQIRIRVDHTLKLNQWRVTLVDVIRVLFSSPIEPNFGEIPF
jgi:hypothetical protein